MTQLVVNCYLAMITVFSPITTIVLVSNFFYSFLVFTWNYIVISLFRFLPTYFLISTHYWFFSSTGITYREWVPGAKVSFFMT